MNKDKLIPITEELRKIAGKQDKGTRIFRREGTFEESGQWFEDLNRMIEGSLVSPGGVSMYASV